MEKLDSAAFEFETNVRYSETTHNGMMSLPALIDIFQDCSIFHSEKVGFGPERLKMEHRAWVLTHWHIVIDRFPNLGEKIVVGTFASGFKTVSAHRNFYLRDASGDMIARANSTWGFIDMDTGKPVRPSTEHAGAYGMGSPLEMPEEEGRKVSLPDALAPSDPVIVRRDLIDTNEHVNNSQYIRIALGALPNEIEAHCVRVDYRRSALLGDKITPCVAGDDDRTVIALRDAEDGLYGAVELR